MAEKKSGGVIYILTNPSFPDYVKIGYATDIEKRLTQLNRSECMIIPVRRSRQSGVARATIPD